MTSFGKPSQEISECFIVLPSHTPLRFGTTQLSCRLFRLLILMSSKKNEILLEILYPAETKLVKLSPERLVGAKAVPAEMPSGLDSSKRSLQRTETLLLPRSEDARLRFPDIKGRPNSTVSSVPKISFQQQVKNMDVIWTSYSFSNRAQHKQPFFNLGIVRRLHSHFGCGLWQ